MRDLTRQERRQIRELVHQCANYDRPDRNCLLLDAEKGRRIACPMLNATTVGRSCKYFTASVLPLNPILETALLCKEPTETRKCMLCGTEFVPKSNRAQYCSEKCQKKGNSIRSRERMRNMREKAG